MLEKNGWKFFGLISFIVLSSKHHVSFWRNMPQFYSFIFKRTTVWARKNWVLLFLNQICYSMFFWNKRSSFYTKVSFSSWFSLDLRLAKNPECFFSKTLWIPSRCTHKVLFLIKMLTNVFFMKDCRACFLTKLRTYKTLVLNPFQAFEMITTMYDVHVS